MTWDPSAQVTVPFFESLSAPAQLPEPEPEPEPEPAPGFFGDQNDDDQ
jgi:hypothetical protein